MKNKLSGQAGLIIAAIMIRSGNTSNLIDTEGRYECEIISVEHAEPKESKFWSDKTPQLKIGYRDNKTGKQFSQWANLVGYMRQEELSVKDKQSGKYESRGEEGYAVVKATGERVQSPEMTEKALSILSSLAFNSGIPADKEISEKQLVGRKVGIVIAGNAASNLRVKSTYMTSEMKEQLQQA